MKFTVLEGGITLLSFLRAQKTDFPSVKAMKRAIDAKMCRVNGRISIMATHKLQEGDVVEISAPPVMSKPQILYEDPLFLAIDKPVGLICTREKINRYLPQYDDQLELIHRLDKETSGVLLIAKCSEGREQFIELFRLGKVKKIYRALCEAKPKEGTIETEIAKGRPLHGYPRYHSVKKGGKLAITKVKALKKVGHHWLVECELVTGRTHQLRVHLSELDAPIVGDFVYGGKKEERIYLCAQSIAFPHPKTGKKVLLTSQTGF